MHNSGGTPEGNGRIGAGPGIIRNPAKYYSLSNIVTEIIGSLRILLSSNRELLPLLRPLAMFPCFKRKPCIMQRARVLHEEVAQWRRTLRFSGISSRGSFQASVF